jgi:hypothetical protein
MRCSTNTTRPLSRGHRAGIDCAIGRRQFDTTIVPNAVTRAIWGEPASAAKMRRCQPYRNDRHAARWKLMVRPAGQTLDSAAHGQPGRQGRKPRLDARDKAIWDPIIEFASREARDGFDECVLAARERQHPEALS